MTSLGHLADLSLTVGLTIAAAGLVALIAAYVVVIPARDAKHRMERTTARGGRTLLSDVRALTARTRGRRAVPSTLTRARTALAARLQRPDAALEAFLAARAEERVEAVAR